MATHATMSSLMLHYSILIFMIYIYPALSHRHPHSHQVQPPYFMHKSINLHPWTLFPLHVTCSLSFPASPRSVDLSPLQIRSLSLINKMPALSIRHFQTESTAPICCPPFPFVGFRSSLTRDHYGEEPNLLGQVFYPCEVFLPTSGNILLLYACWVQQEHNSFFHPSTYK